MPKSSGFQRRATNELVRRPAIGAARDRSRWRRGHALRSEQRLTLPHVRIRRQNHGGLDLPLYRFRKMVSIGVKRIRLTTACACLVLTACGGAATGSAPAAPSPAPVSAPAPAAPTSVTISAAGLNPQEITVDAGTQLAFTNNDIAPHDVAGGPDPAHPDCREIDEVGFLTPGQTKRTGVLTRTCDYHDHSNHAPIFNGRIVVR